MSKQDRAAKAIKFAAARGYTPEQIATLLNELNLLAPELAESELAREVLRMRREISDLYKAVARTGTDCAIRDDHQGKLAARVAQSVAEQLFRILQEGGDHHE